MEAGTQSGGAAPKKPVRLWLLQVICVLQIGRNGYSLVSCILEDGAPKTSDEFVWLAGVLLVILLGVLLILAVQRWAPRPGVTAPVIGGLWWLDGMYYFVRDLVAPGKELVPGQVVGGVLAEAIMLVFVVWLFAHAKTRHWLVDRGG